MGRKKSEYHGMELGALCSGYKHVPSETVHLFVPVYRRIPSEATLSSSEKVEPVTTIAAVVMFTTKF